MGGVSRLDISQSLSSCLQIVPHGHGPFFTFRTYIFIFLLFYVFCRQLRPAPLRRLSGGSDLCIDIFLRKLALPRPLLPPPFHAWQAARRLPFCSLAIVGLIYACRALRRITAGADCDIRSGLVWFLYSLHPHSSPSLSLSFTLSPSPFIRPFVHLTSFFFFFPY